MRSPNHIALDGLVRTTTNAVLSPGSVPSGTYPNLAGAYNEAFSTRLLALKPHPSERVHAYYPGSSCVTTALAVLAYR